MFPSGGVAWCALFLYSHHQPRLKEFFQFYLAPLVIDKNMH